MRLRLKGIRGERALSRAFGSMPTTMLAMQFWALCASASLAVEDRWLRPGPLSVWSVEVVAEDLGSGRVVQLRHRLRLDLPDPLLVTP